MRSADPPTLDLSAAAAALAEDLCLRAPQLAHIDLQTTLFALARSRAEGTHGTYARIVPLRFAEGRQEMTRRRGRHLETFRMPPLRHDGREIFYVVHLLVPRFLRLSPEQKLTTIIHELYHISESCNGDIRRFAGRNFAHGSSRHLYDRKVREILESYLGSGPDLERFGFLKHTEEDWLQGGLRLTGLQVPLPRARLIRRERI